MKKLRLTPDELHVTSFAAADKPRGAGTVHGMTGYSYCQPSAEETQCLCTFEEGCYPSLYCSGAGCVITVQAGCMTNNHSHC